MKLPSVRVLFRTAQFIANHPIASMGIAGDRIARTSRKAYLDFCFAHAHPSIAFRVAKSDATAKWNGMTPESRVFFIGISGLAALKYGAVGLAVAAKKTDHPYAATTSSVVAVASEILSWGWIGIKAARTVKALQEKEAERPDTGPQTAAANTQYEAG